jgi:hypothetical protein
MVRGWVRAGKKTIVKVDDELPIYIHDFCLNSVQHEQDTLF